jgi:hypothetical protein
MAKGGFGAGRDHETPAETQYVPNCTFFFPYDLFTTEQFRKRKDRRHRENYEKFRGISLKAYLF